MRCHSLLMSLAMAAATVCSAAPALAQTQGGSRAPIAVTAGFSLLHDLNFSDPTNSYSSEMPGFLVAVASQRSEKLSLVGEFGINHKTYPLYGPWTRTSFMGGARYYVHMKNAKLRPMGQFLIGINHTSNGWGNTFTFQPGVGIVYAITDKIDFR